MECNDGTLTEWPDKFNHIRKILGRSGPLSPAEFQPGIENMDFMENTCKVLVIGAGGLGCELLKNMGLTGFRNIHVVDMDTIDLSNLNRQFLFRHSDIGKPKAEVAATFINNRIRGCCVVPHFAKIQDFDVDFYRSFHIVVCGLDSIVARRWINGMLVSLLVYNDAGELDQSSVIPMVDGGTEGFKGNARVILPGLTACVECTLDFYPPQVNFPLCTIAHTPRLPEHCIEYVRLLLWSKENPFQDASIDGDNPEHILWILKRSQERAKEFNITGVDYRLTQGVVKNIIPAVASTNAVIAAICATEVFKIAVSCYQPLNNYINFNDTDGVYTYTFEAEKKDDCAACSMKQQQLSFGRDDSLASVIEFLQRNSLYQLKCPALITEVEGKSKTLYMSTVKSLEEATKANLKKSLKDLKLEDGQVIYVADPTSPNNLIFKLKLS